MESEPVLLHPQPHPRPRLCSIDEGEPERQGPRLKISKKAILTGLVSLVVAIVGITRGFSAYRFFTTHEETDDAYVTGHLHQVSSRLNGTVAKVLVDDNEHVREGQVLVELDPRDFQVKVDQAVASLARAERSATTAASSISFQDTKAGGDEMDARGSIDNARASISRARARVREARAAIDMAHNNLEAKEAELVRATLDYKRFIALERQGAITTRERDAARRDYFVALGERDSARHEIDKSNEVLEQAQQSVVTTQADLVRAEARLRLARASAVQTRVSEHQYKTDLAAVAVARAAVEEARLNLSYTRIQAPRSGRIGKKTVEEGQRVEPGEPLLTIVADNPWVVANFKETQLKKMRTGQHVEIKIDSFPDHRFVGTIDSFSPASGASFAILPSDNATGNFTKIVQRVPVKIVFDGESLSGYEERLAPGLSAIATVDVAPRYTPGELLGMSK
ncbi:MAG: HlyD family secretion protein [Candidatus Obscuribacterales bacterium]